MDKFEIITQAFDQVESDLKDSLERGEIDEKQHAVSLAALLKQRIEKLCEAVPGFREEFDRLLKEEK
jgi:hypothetical protein